MERLDGGSAVPERLRGGIVALGNFDGFHKGHQAVVGRAVALARAQGRPALVATFEPHPMRFFRPESPWFRLTPMEQRARLIEAAGVDGLFRLLPDGTSERGLAILEVRAYGPQLIEPAPANFTSAQY